MGKYMKNKVRLSSGGKIYHKENFDLFMCEKCKRRFPIADKVGKICKKCDNKRKDFRVSK